MLIKKLTSLKYHLIARIVLFKDLLIKELLYWWLLLASLVDHIEKIVKLLVITYCWKNWDDSEAPSGRDQSAITIYMLNGRNKCVHSKILPSIGECCERQATPITRQNPLATGRPHVSYNNLEGTIEHTINLYQIIDTIPPPTIQASLEKV